MPPPAATAGPASAALRGAMEALVLALTAAAPWAFGAVHPVAVFGLYCGLAGVLVLWAVLLLIERRIAGGACGVLACLAGMVLLGAAQLVPLPATVSPATAALRAALIPAEPAALAGEAAVPPPPPTVSLVPGATRKRVLELVAVVVLFAAVRYAVASPASFRRLAVVSLANAAALAVFALAQRFGGEPGTAYGVFRTRGEPFGPFVCRNHFPFYTNVCVGLGVGLLLAGPPFAGRRGGWADALADLGRRPAALWLLAGLALVVAANALSLSRGGVVALGTAGAACALLAAGRHGGGVLGLGAVAAAAAGLVLWFGPAATAARLATLDDSPLAEGRLQVWQRVVPLAADFPLWGTGYGTFEFVEPLTRGPGDDPALLWDHPHNDYLETLIEGGAAQLLIALAAVGLLARAGVRAFARPGTPADGPLALGALLGVGTAVVHAAGDFGMHIPAVVVLVTVVAAQLAAAGARAKGTATAAAGLPVAVLVAAACAAAAVVLPLDGWKRERAHRFWLAATRAEARLPAGERGPAIDYLAAAAAWNPDDTAVAAALADFRYSHYQTHRAAGRTDTEATHLLPALRADLHTRAANPLLPRPHLRLAAHADRLAPPEPPAAALARACRLAPADPTVWFLAGTQALADGDHDAACARWRRSLDSAPAHLAAIIPAARPVVGPAGLVGRVVPPQAELLAAAAKLLPDADRPAFAAAAAAAAQPATAAEFHARGWLLREAGDPAAAAAYEDALARAPDRADWRFELAELLAAAGRTADAAAHLRPVLRDRPDYPGARELNAELVRRGAGRGHPTPGSPQ